MAPQSSAISSALPSRRSKSNRNRLALVDPSSIRRSPRLTPTASNTISVRSGELLSSDFVVEGRSGGRVKRYSAERRLIVENLGRIGGGGIGNEFGGGGGSAISSSSRKRSWTSDALIDTNSIRRSSRLRGNGGDGVHASNKVQFQSLGDESCNKRSRKSIGDGVSLKEFGDSSSGGGGKSGRRRSWTSNALIDTNSIRRSSRLRGNGSDNNNASNKVEFHSLGDGNSNRKSRKSIGDGKSGKEFGDSGGGGKSGRRRSWTSNALIDTSSIRRSSRLCGNGGDNINASNKVELQSLGDRSSNRRSRKSIGDGKSDKEFSDSGGGGKSGKRRSWTSNALIDTSSIRRSSRLRGNRGDNIDESNKVEFQSIGNGSSYKRSCKSIGVGEIGKDFGDSGDGKSGRRSSWTGSALIDPKSIRRSSRLFCVNGGDDASKKVEFQSIAVGNADRSSRKSISVGVPLIQVEHEEPLRIFPSDYVEFSLEEGSRRMSTESYAVPLPKGIGKKVSFFVGNPVPKEEAKRRWPWRFEKEKKRRKPQRLESDINEDELVLNVKCHYLQAELEKCVFELGDYAYIKGENGRENYIGKIVEFFKTNDNREYFRVQWFFRATDTVMKEAAESHDRKRLFYSELMNDNLLDCIVSKLKIIQVKPNENVKSKAIAACDFYYDMKYSVDYSTFCTMSSHRSFPSSFDREPLSSDGTIHEIEERNSYKPCKSELTLLDIYSGCGAMSMGLCLGAKASGLQLSTKWAIDMNKSACETLKLNHTGIQVRNESAEDFLGLLKEWEILCKRYGVNKKENLSESNSKSGAEKSIQSSASEKSVSGEYEVERIVDICYSDADDGGKRGLKFKVRWKGYGPSEDTWEPVDGLRKCQDAIKDFVRKGYLSKILPLPGDVDVICGGPPCQGISGYNRFRNFLSPMDDERNHQIVVFMDLVKYLKPKYVLMENVSDLLKFAKGTLGRYALSRLVEMNYQARLGIMAAGCYGLAQFRLRVFLWGANPFQNLPQFPLPTHDVVIRYGAPTEFERNIVAYDEGQTRKLEKALVLADAISDLPPVSSLEACEVMTYTKPPNTEFQKYIRATESEMLGFASCTTEQAGKALLYDHRAFPLSQDDYLRVCLVPKRKGANFRDLPGVTVDYNNVAKRDPATEKLLPSGKPYVPEYALNFSDGKSLRPFARLWWDETVPTVLCKMDSHSNAVLHPEQDRILSLRECARLQGFPDYFRFCGDLKDRYSQVGNAVAVPVARALGYALGVAYQQLSDPSEPLITLPPKFSHSTTCELLAESPYSAMEETILN